MAQDSATILLILSRYSSILWSIILKDSECASLNLFNNNEVTWFISNILFALISSITPLTPKIPFLKCSSIKKNFLDNLSL